MFTTMLGLRPAIILSFSLALLVNIVSAGSGGKIKPSCDKCQTKAHDCELVRETNLLKPR